MKKIIIAILCAGTLFSCASKKDLEAALAKQQSTQELLDTATVKLNACLSDEKAAQARLSALQSEIQNLRESNASLLNNVGDLATLSKKDAEILETSLERIKEKDLQIRSLNDALTKKDSVTIALVTSIKSSLGNVNDEDINVNVEKGVVFISISDKLLFSSGSDQINSNAYNVLGKVGTILKDKSNMEVMIEGHTDSQPIASGKFKDNWDLSTARAASITRYLQEKEQIDPARMTAAGRSYYVPIASNDTAEGRAKNRRTRIIILPKLDQFFDMIESGMEQAKIDAKKQ
ncbi:MULTISPECIES: OmpA family protein [Nonlabens]|uniref:Chemotaxis protein MotB n=1 Tax=Nonlabens ulvanivorans TaxID=906888 RepID=A0A084JW29_NONUL|nr:OmpA family protein [Nonlabens ulvanivorans]KEZ93163.1 membrane protein [Nonlabens ulvanivorans]PRX13717.1 chemotaxis protein MotB [Nonlabens ulvanivorans]WOI23974.1 OmpA family protein [Nonlabens ulvanivorans]GAK77195.1 flagellar motor rotation protein MotB [Nonlabens ulvanivorans]GAK99770.1 flagellar motor rotation protein MotB [Nonlabens ulvanivorans]